MSKEIKAINKHPETYMSLDELGTTYPEYRPTFAFSSTYIDSAHKFYSTCPVNGALIQIKKKRWGSEAVIPGWLRREDALKLYEMAYFAPGDILELGPYHGLSTTILAQAVRRSRQRKKIYSVDLNPVCLKETKRNLRAKGFYWGVRTICSDAAMAIKALNAEQRKFAFVFVDHSHAYEPVFNVCQVLDTVMLKGGFCLFHDFNDPRNRDEDNESYGVYQAVTDGLDESKFEFYGIYGCTALYRMK